MQPSQRARDIPPSATLTISARASQLKAAGEDVVNLSVGQPDFDTPAHIIEAAERAIRDGATRYTPTAGTPALREAVAAELSALTGQDYGLPNVVVTNGAKQVLHNLMQALVDPGDEVIVPAPYWVSYEPMVQLAEGRMVVVPTRLEDGFRLTADQLRESLTPNSRVLLLNSPSNPTGAAYSEAQLRALAEVVLEHPRLVVLSDEIYRKLVYGDHTHTSFAALGDDAAARCFVVDGVSKAYAMTGWRVGYAAGDPEVIAGAIRYQDHTTSCAAAGSQAAALAAITGPQDAMAEMRVAFERRLGLLRGRLDAIDGLAVHPPEGAFYAFVSMAALGEQAQDDIALAQKLIEERFVAAVPGTAFGAPGHLRLSFATSSERINTGLDRLESFIAELRS